HAAHREPHVVRSAESSADGSTPLIAFVMSLVRGAAERPVSMRLDQAELKGTHSGLRPRGDRQLAKDPAQVVADCPGFEKKPNGDFTVRMADDEQPQDLSLALGETYRGAGVHRGDVAGTVDGC